MMGDSQYPLQFFAESFPGVTVGGPLRFSVTSMVGYGAPPYRFEITNGHLPEGLTLSEDGTVSGVIKSPVPDCTIVLQVTDAAGSSIHGTFVVQVMSD
jgi:hypothetical protein